VPNTAGTVTYTPDPGWSGTASFMYWVHDGKGATNSATVTVVRPDTYSRRMKITFFRLPPPRPLTSGGGPRSPSAVGDRRELTG
jgi:hypothetical protein